MSMKEQMNEEPQSVSYEEHGEWTTVLLRTNIERIEEGEGDDKRVFWTDELTRIIVLSKTLTNDVRSEIEADPSGYVRKVEVDDAKPEARAAVQSWIDRVTRERTTIACDGMEAGIVFDTQACINAMGLEAGDVFIDAADGVHAIKSAADVARIKGALKSHVAGLYAKATEWRKRIDAAETREEIEKVLSEING